MKPGRHPKLTRAQREEIVSLGKLHRETSPKMLARKFGVAVVTIYNIHGGMHFQSEHPSDRVQA